MFSLRRYLERFRAASPTAVPFDPLSTCAEALAETLPEDWQVFRASQRGRPTIAQALRQVLTRGLTDLVVLPMHPEYSPAATGRIMSELYRRLSRVAHVNLTTRATWHDDSGYINAQARLVAEYATTQGLVPQDTRLIFTANSWRGSTVLERSPYEDQLRQTTRLIADRVGWPADRTAMVFEGESGIGQSMRDTGGNESLLLCSLDVLNGGRARVVPFEVPGGQVHVCPALATYEPFIAAVKNLILRGPRPVIPGSTPVKPLLVPNLRPDEAERELGSLAVVGVSIPGRVPSRRGPYVMHSDARLFCSVKKSRRELRSFLDWVREQERISEGFVWNTCQRVEFYSWLAEPENLAEREYVIAQVGQRLFGAGAAELKLNVMFGSDAWHHLMRTVTGLNSGLPGDTDLVTQLQTSCRVAERTGAAGLRATRLVGNAVRLAQDVRDKTAWGRFSPGYCLAALSRVCDVDGARLHENRHVVIGGSATSRSILTTLSDSFQVPQRQMTLVYRDHHGQMKLLRSALGHGKRLRVHSYADPRVLREIATADLVFFGVDHADPVLDLNRLTGIRDFVGHPLTVVDFNSFGSMDGEGAPRGVTVWTAKDLDGAVAAYADAMCSKPQFAGAVAEAEEWIEQRLPGAVARSADKSQDNIASKSDLASRDHEQPEVESKEY
jgi:glutamyl-tRNA reductase